MVAVRYGGLGTNMSAHSYWISYTNEGVLISRDQPDAPEPFRACHSSPEMAGFVEQLQDEAYAADTPAGAAIPWEALYALIDDRNYASSLHLLHLPPVSDMTLRLASQGSLTDRDFRITFAAVDAARQAGGVDGAARWHRADRHGLAAAQPARVAPRADGWRLQPPYGC